MNYCFYRNLAFLLMLGILGQTAFAQLKWEKLALSHVHVVDVKTKSLLEDHTVLIEGEKIVALEPSVSATVPEGFKQIDMSGKYLIPGLIDAHVHLATDPTAEFRAGVEKTLYRMLSSGVTTVRDMAGDARALASLSRDALVGDIHAPNIYYAALMAGEGFFDDPRTIATAQGGVSGQMPYMLAINSETQFDLAVAMARGTGATGIKLYADLDAELARAVINEANKQNIVVWAHTGLFPAKPSEVIEAGATSISHSGMFCLEKYARYDELPKSWTTDGVGASDDAFWEQQFEALDLDPIFDKMLERGTLLDATLSVYVADSTDKRIWRRKLANWATARAYERGVKVCAGTDTDQKTFVQEEMKLLVNECGFSAIDAIRAATLHGAEALGMQEFLGFVEPGAQADMLLLNDNPMEDIHNIDSVYMVIKGGSMYNAP